MLLAARSFAALACVATAGIAIIGTVPRACAFQPKRHRARGWRPETSLSVFSSNTIERNLQSIRKAANNKVYLRWKKDGDTWKMQTAVKTFQRGLEKIDLHAQVHFGNKDYFDFYNSEEFLKDLKNVHFELLVDDELLEYKDSAWRLGAPIMASPSDQNLARSYGWTCQASEIDYTNPKWIHADLSRQEFLKLVDNNGNGQQQPGQKQPLWKLASPDAQFPSAAAEAVSALLVGPPQLSYSTRFLKRRLFSNPFLPGTQFASALRAVLWLTIPAPELSIILVDWASLLDRNGEKINPSPLSDVAFPILSSLVKLDLASTRRFLFGQVLASSNSMQAQQQRVDSGDKAWTLLVTKRNDHALDVLKKTLSDHEKSRVNSETIHTALLYGSSHCPDIHTKLVGDGFRATKTRWRTAWSVRESDQDSIWPGLSAALLVYLGLGALDWVTCLGEVSQTVVDGNYLDSGLVMSLYLARHVLLYVGLSKFLVDWTNSID